MTAQRPAPIETLHGPVCPNCMAYLPEQECGCGQIFNDPDDAYSDWDEPSGCDGG